MIWLVIGVALFAAAHLATALDLPVRRASIARFGRDGHRGIFSLVVLASVALIVVGWRTTEPVLLYAVAPWSRVAANVGMAIAFLLFVASGAPSNLRRGLRHPQLLSVVLWSASHLIANGDQRSVVLFGGLGLWAVITMPLLNRRDGAWERPAPTPLVREAVVVAIAVGVFLAVRWAHPWIAGVSALY